MNEELNPSDYNYCSECRSSEQYAEKLEAEIRRLREEINDLKAVVRCYQLGWHEQ